MNKDTVAKASIQINAPREKVWNVLTDFDRWPEWQKSVSAASLDEKLAIGSSFRWKGGGMNIVSTFTDVKAPRTIVWKGKAFGMQARHRWELTPNENGTVVSSEDVLSGWFVSFIKFFKPTFFQTALDSTLQELKEELEHNEM